MYPKIYTRDWELMAILDNIIEDTASVKRVINGEFTFSFGAFEKELKSEYFDPNNIIFIADQAFDIKYIEQNHDVDIRYTIQCEHVNYRMEDGDENKYESYAFTGTPSQILADILSGTEFSVGVVDFTDEITVAVQSEITRKRLIYELAALIGGELDYTDNGFTINIRNTIGQDNGFQVRFGKNLKGIRKIIDNRGELKTSYSVDIVELKNSNEYIEQELQDLEVVGVGDTIQIIDEVIGLDIQNRVVSIEYNPIFAVNTRLEIANTIALITDKITGIDTELRELGEETFSRIERTNSEISSEVARATLAESELDGKISTTEEALNTKITQTAEAIVSEANRATRVEEELYGKIISTEDTLSSMISQTAEEIASEVTRATRVEGQLDGKIASAEESLGTRISQTAQSVTQEATRASEAEGNLSGRIDTLAGTVILKVDANGNIASVRLDATSGGTSIKLKAANIELEGLVTANSKFKILADGSIEAVGGKFSGTITASNISGSTLSSVGSSYSTTISDGSISTTYIYMSGYGYSDYSLHTPGRSTYQNSSYVTIVSPGSISTPTLDAVTVYADYISGNNGMTSGSPIHSGNIGDYSVGYATNSYHASQADYATSAGSASSAGSAGSASVAYNLQSYYGVSIYISSNDNLIGSRSTYIGTSGNPFAGGWSTNGWQTTSDEDCKLDVKVPDGRYLEFAKRLIPYSYKMKEGTSGRDHLGYMAQQVKQAMDDSGISDKEFAGWIAAPIYSKELLDGDYDTSSEIIGYRYGLRYDEVQMLYGLMIKDLYEKISKLGG